MRARATAYGEPFAYRPEDRAVHGGRRRPGDGVARRRPRPIRSASRSRSTSPSRSTTSRCSSRRGGSRAPHRAGDDRRRRPPAGHRRARRPRRSSPDGQRVDIDPTTGPSTVTITIDSVVVPDPTLGPALAAVGFAEIDTGLEPTVEVVRPPADAVDAIAAAGDAPVSFVLTRLRTRPSDRWRSDPEPAMVREIELPDDRVVRRRRSPCASTSGPTDDVLAELLGIDGPTGDEPADRRGRRRPGGRPPTATRRRRGSRRSAAPSASALTFTRRRAVRRRSSSPSRAATTHRSRPSACRRRRRRRRRAAAGRRRAQHRHAPAPVPAGDVTLEITVDRAAGHARPALRRAGRAAGRDRELSVGAAAPACRRRSTPGAATTSLAHRRRSRCRSACAATVAAAARRRRPSTPPRAAATTIDLDAGDAPHHDGAGRGTGLDVDRVVLAAPDRPPRRAAGGPTATVTDAGPHEPRGHRRRLPRRLLARARRGLPRVVVGVDRRRRSRPAAARRRRLQRLVDRAERRAGRRCRSRWTAQTPADDRPRRSPCSPCSRASPSPSLDRRRARSRRPAPARASPSASRRCRSRRRWIAGRRVGRRRGAARRPGLGRSSPRWPSAVLVARSSAGPASPGS